MKLAFYLPRIYYGPGGGAKIVLEYANYLAGRGHDVAIYYHVSKISFKSIKCIKHNTRVLLDIFIGKIYGCRRWFPLQNNIKEKIINDVSCIKPCDIVIATAIQLVEPVLDLPESFKKVYLIQGYETWEVSEDELSKIVRRSNYNVVISKWLQKKIGAICKEPMLIPNAIDTNIFKNSHKIREKNSIVFHYRSAEIKGCDYGIETIKILLEKYPNLIVKVITTEKSLPSLPKCCRVYYNIPPTQVAEINNSCKIFMCTSIEEGFGLPGLEAMACGCALVSTNYDAVFDYAVNNYNAFLSPVRDVEQMVNNISLLFEDDDLRLKIANNGEETAKKRSKDQTYIMFEEYLMHVINGG